MVFVPLLMKIDYRVPQRSLNDHVYIRQPQRRTAMSVRANLPQGCQQYCCNQFITSIAKTITILSFQRNKRNDPCNVSQQKRLTIDSPLICKVANRHVYAFRNSDWSTAASHLHACYAYLITDLLSTVSALTVLCLTEDHNLRHAHMFLQKRHMYL